MPQQEKSKKPLSQIENLTVFHQGGQSQDQSLKGEQSQSQDRTQSDESQASRDASQAQASQDVALQYDRQELSSPDSSFSQEMTPELWIKVQDANYRLIDNGLIRLDDDINQQESVSETQSQPVYSSRLNRFHTRFRAGPRFQNPQDAKISYSQ